MKLAVCLLSCGRHDLTTRTVETFVKHNEAADPRFVLLQADEPIMGPQSGALARAAGFQTVFAPARRGGQMAALRALVQAAEQAGCDQVLWLENDWETVAPVPWDKIGQADVVRLFGRLKGPDQLSGGSLLGAKTPIAWSSPLGGWQRGAAHWPGGASIIETRILRQFAGSESLKALIKASEPLDTLRPVDNVMVSMGAPTTPGLIQ